MMRKRRTLDAHKFVPAYASTTKCVTCQRNRKHWLHRGILYRMFHQRPDSAYIPRNRQ